MSAMHYAESFAAPSAMPPLGAVLEKLYGSLVEPREPRAGMDAVRRLFRVDHLAIICRSSDSPTQVSGAFISDDTPRPEYEQHYIDSFRMKDPFINLPPDRPLIVQEFMDERTWQGHDFFQQFLKPMDVYHVMGADIPVRPSMVYSVRLCRHRDAEPFSRDDLCLLQEMLPHLRHFGTLHAVISHAQMVGQVLDSVAKSMNIGALVLDRNARVVHTTGLAGRRLSRREGFYLSSGRLRASSPANDMKLQHMIHTASAIANEGREGEPQATRFEAGTEGASMGVALRNLPVPGAPGSGQQVSTLVVFRDFDSESDISEANLRRLFDFTKAEARLAQLLAQGLTIDEAAERLAVSRNTLRTHLRSVFVKTGTSRQSELVRTLVSGISVFC